MKLKIGNRYSYKVGRRIRTGKYLGKYFNKPMRRWYLKFETFYGMYHTPPKCETEIFICMKALS